MSAGATAPEQAPIGVYDSGIGGVSVLLALRERLPDQTFIYVADSGHAPYGDRPAPWVVARAGDVARFLLSQHVAAIVLACNTASALASSALRADHAVPFVAMEPAIKPAVASSRAKVVMVLATEHTLNSPAVARLVERFGGTARIVLQACPGLADRVEAGTVDDAETTALLRRYLARGLRAGADTLVLGCTHYAFLTPLIRSIAGAQLDIIEPSKAIAEQLVRVLPPGHDAQPGRADTVFFTSGSVAGFRARLRSIWPAPARVLALPCD